MPHLTNFEPSKEDVLIWRSPFESEASLTLNNFAEPAEEEKKITYGNMMVFEVTLSRMRLPKYRPPSSTARKCLRPEIWIEMNRATCVN